MQWLCLYLEQQASHLGLSKSSSLLPLMPLSSVRSHRTGPKKSKVKLGEAVRLLAKYSSYALSSRFSLQERFRPSFISKSGNRTAQQTSESPCALRSAFQESICLLSLLLSSYWASSDWSSPVRSSFSALRDLRPEDCFERCCSTCTLPRLSCAAVLSSSELEE